MQIWLYAKYFDQSNLALLVLISGYSVFLSWIDAGISRPIYPSLRKKYLNGDDISTDISYILYFYILIGMLAVALFTIAVIILTNIISNSLSSTVVIIMAINLAINTAISFFKNIFNAIDRYISFEVTELIRRVGNISTSFLLVLDHSLLLTVCCQLAILLGTYCYVTGSLLRLSGINLLTLCRIRLPFLIKYFLQYRRETLSYLLFMVNETLIYNWGYLIIPVFLDIKQVVVYGLWMRIYSGMATVMRAVSDVTIHTITKSFFQNRHDAARTMKKNTLMLSLCVSFTMIGVFTTLHRWIMAVWVHDKYQFDTLLLIGLASWLIGNSIQHVAGTFLVSIGGYFQTIRNLSFYLVGAIAFVMTASAWYTINLGTTVLLSGCIYLIGAIFYHFISEKAFSVKAK